MEKKTIGGFIAALRRANGMTQKELADRLNVSDKTVSRWERDEGAPDLSLIPVIAEVFGVTCDELLRGQRRSPAERTEGKAAPEATEKGERERRRILKSTLADFKNRSLIAVSLAAAGLIAALICNFAFLRASLGVYVGALFFVAAAVCQIIFTNRALFAVDDEEPDTPEKADFRRRVVILTRNVLAIAAGLLGFTAPMAAVDAYLGLSVATVFIFGVPFAAAFLAAFAVIWYFVYAHLVKKGVVVLGEREGEIYRRNHRLKGRCAGILLAVALMTGIAQAALNQTELWIKGTVFDDYESFGAFMKQDIPDTFYGAEPPSDVYEIVSPEGDAQYVDVYGNEITKEEYDRRQEEYYRREIKDEDGKVLFTYQDRNGDVVRVNYSVENGSALPITVYTRQDVRAAEEKTGYVNAAFLALYILESAAAVTVYWFKKSRKDA